MKRNTISWSESLEALLERRTRALLEHVISDVTSYQEEELTAENSKREELIPDPDQVPKEQEQLLQSKFNFLKARMQSLHNKFRSKEIEYLLAHANVIEELEEFFGLLRLEEATDSWSEFLEYWIGCTKFCKFYWKDLLKLAKEKLTHQEQEKKLIHEELEKISTKIKNDERHALLRDVKKRTLRENIKKSKKKIASIAADIVHHDKYLHELQSKFDSILSLITNKRDERFEPELFELKQRRDILVEEVRHAELLARATALKYSLIEMDINRLQSGGDVKEDLTAQETENQLRELTDKMLDLELESNDCDMAKTSVLSEAQRKIDAVYVDLWLLTQHNEAVVPVVQHLLREHSLQPLPREFPTSLLPPLPSTDEDMGWPSSPEALENASLPNTPPAPPVLPSTPCLKFADDDASSQQNKALPSTSPVSCTQNSEEKIAFSTSSNPNLGNNSTTHQVLKKDIFSSSSKSCLKKSPATQQTSVFPTYSTSYIKESKTPLSSHSTSCLKTPTQMTPMSYTTPCLKTPSSTTPNSTPCLKRKETQSPISTYSNPCLKNKRYITTPPAPPSTPATPFLKNSGSQVLNTSVTSAPSPCLKTSVSLKRRKRTSSSTSTDSLSE